MHPASSPTVSIACLTWINHELRKRVEFQDQPNSLISWASGLQASLVAGASAVTLIALRFFAI